MIQGMLLTLRIPLLNISHIGLDRPVENFGLTAMQQTEKWRTSTFRAEALRREVTSFEMSKFSLYFSSIVASLPRIQSFLRQRLH